MDEANRMLGAQRWAHHLRHCPVLDFKHMPPRPSAHKAGATHQAPCPDVAPQAGAALCGARGQRQLAMALAGLAALAVRYTDQTDLLVEVFHAGSFDGGVPVLLSLDPQAPLQATIDSVAQQLEQARQLAAQWPYALAAQTEVLPSPGLVLRLRDAPASALELAGDRPLALDLCVGQDTVSGVFHVQAGLFDAQGASALAQRFVHLLAGWFAAPATPLCRLCVFTPQQQEALRSRWAGDERSFAAPALIHRIFEDTARRLGDTVAAVHEGASITFAELDERADRCSAGLARCGAVPGDLVGIHMRPSIDLVVALLGVLKAGCAFVPLDPGYPQARIDFMVEDSRVRLVFSDSPLDMLGGAWVVRVPDLEASVQRDADMPALGEQVDPDGDPLLYVMYTSGSTGRPKGAMLTHAGIRNRLLWGIDEYRLGPGHTVLFKTSISFDACIWEIFAPLLSGARLVIARQDGNRDVDYLIALVLAQQVSHIDFVPSMLEPFLASPDIGRCSSLRLMTCAGEPLTHALLGEVFSKLPGVVVYNLYGPTEASMAVTHWHCRALPPDPLVPIGRAMANVRMYVLDRYGQLAMEGVVGEICIGGMAPGPGYLGQPEKTAAAFVPDPFGQPGDRMYRTGDLGRMLEDGSLYFLGRADQQVKIRGQRVELGEIESQLASHPLVRGCVVLVREFARGDQRLVAWVTLKDGAPAEALAAARLREFAMQVLPPHMVPSHVQVSAGFPLTPNGKADRLALAALPIFKPVLLLPPAADPAQSIASVFQQLLGAPTVGLDDDFFELGGHSLLAIKAVAQLKTQGLKLDIGQVFELRTARALAGAARRCA